MERTNGSTSTLPNVVQRRASEGAGVQPHLFLVLHADHPLTTSARYVLQDVRELTLGRASEGRSERLENLGSSRYRLTVPDRWMSSLHAVLRHDADHW